MRVQHSARSGFTLTEMVIATSILVMALGLAMTGYLYMWSESNKATTQDELDIDVQVSIEKVKRDLRLSALEKMYYYPQGPGPYTAISMPLARDDNGDSVVDVDADGRIIWDKTVIYHRWTGNPAQLRKTVFDPRDNTLTPTQMQAQVDSVAVTGNGTATYGATNATTSVVFQNLFQWEVSPQSSTYDGYAPATARDLATSLGSAVISGGTHTISFHITGKNPSSSGYRLGIDSLFMSPSASPREAEAQLPASAVVGAVPTNVYMAGGSWSGNYHLHFPATAVGHTFALSLPNDRWEETNFRATGEVHEDTTVQFDTTLTPNDIVLQLDGTYGINWQAVDQIGSVATAQTVADHVQGCAVRVLVRGSNVQGGGAIEYPAGRCWVWLRAGGLGAFTVTDVFIAEAAVTNDVPTMDAVPGTMTRLVALGGANGTTMGANNGVYMGYPANFSMKRDKSYLVTYLVSGTAGNGNAQMVVRTNDAAYAAAYVIPFTNAPTATDAQANTWSTRSDVYRTNAILGLEYTWGTHATNGLYTSTIFDTTRSAPAYSTIAWGASVPSGTYMGVKVRSGNSNNLSDAASWTNITAITTQGSINPGNKRYVQFQVQMRPSAAFPTVTPQLRDLRISWPGETRVVDIGGTFTKGSDYGIFDLRVNGQPLKKGVVVDLEIFDFVRGQGTSNRITSAATAEVTPRNSGR